MPQYHLKTEVSSQKNPRIFSVFLSALHCPEDGSVLEGAFPHPVCQGGQYFLLYLRAWRNFGCPSFSLSFLKAEASFLRIACINYVLSCYYHFLCPNKSLPSLKISAPAPSSLFLPHHTPI